VSYSNKFHGYGANIQENTVTTHFTDYCGLHHLFCAKCIQKSS